MSPTLIPDFAALPETPVTFRPPPGLFESPSLRPRGFSISTCSQHTHDSYVGLMDGKITSE